MKASADPSPRTCLQTQATSRPLLPSEGLSVAAEPCPSLLWHITMDCRKLKNLSTVPIVAPSELPRETSADVDRALIAT